jgi:hypothetical protein
MSVKALFDNIKTELKPITIEGLGEIYIRKLTLKQRTKLFGAFVETETEDAKANVAMIEAIKACVCESDGSDVFSDKDDDFLYNLPSTIIDEISTAILEYNGMGEVKEEIKEEAKN